jgi:hypothetical protein
MGGRVIAQGTVDEEGYRDVADPTGPGRHERAQAGSQLRGPVTTRIAEPGGGIH